MFRRLATALAIVTAIAVLPTAAAAQQIALKGGINFATLTDADEFPESSSRLGGIGGVSVVVPTGGRVSFVVEGLFSEKGLSLDNQEVEDIDISADLRIRYIEVPVLGRFDFGASGTSTRFFVVGGAAPAFKIGARIKAEAGDVGDSDDISDDVEDFDLGLVGGLGVEFGRALIEARYTHGLMSIAKDDGDEFDSDDSVKNRVFSVMVGYRFR